MIYINFVLNIKIINVHLLFFNAITTYKKYILYNKLRITAIPIR